MSVKTVEIIERLLSLTLLETAELVKQIEVTFGVDASVKIKWEQVELPVIHDIEPPLADTEYDVILMEVPADKKISIMKIVRSLTGLGLKEAKDLVDSTPKTLHTGFTLSEAQDIKQQLEVAGATVALR